MPNSIILQDQDGQELFNAISSFFRTFGLLFTPYPDGKIFWSSKSGALAGLRAQTQSLSVISKKCQP